MLGIRSHFSKKSLLWGTQIYLEVWNDTSFKFCFNTKSILYLRLSMVVTPCCEGMSRIVSRKTVEILAIKLPPRIHHIFFMWLSSLYKENTALILLTTVVLWQHLCRTNSRSKFAASLYFTVLQLHLFFLFGGSE